jgi:hypothetical protein
MEENGRATFCGGLSLCPETAHGVAGREIRTLNAGRHQGREDRFFRIREQLPSASDKNRFPKEMYNETPPRGFPGAAFFCHVVF